VVPESASLSIGVFLQRQLLNQFLDDSVDVLGVDAAQSGVHPQRLTDRHLIYECVELWTEAHQTTTSSRHACSSVKTQQLLYLTRKNMSPHSVPTYKVRQKVTGPANRSSSFHQL